MSQCVALKKRHQYNRYLTLFSMTAEATEKERKFFLAELEVMKAIQPHPNILPLIGCYTSAGNFNSLFSQI